VQAATVLTEADGLVTDGSRQRLDADVARLADGDRSVAGVVFTTLWPIMHTFCVRSLGSLADADDAAQVAMEKVFAEVADYDRSRPALPWALAIAAWECRTLQRQRQRRRQEPLREADALPSRSLDPEEAVGLRELQEAASAVLQELSVEDRETLLAAFSEDAEERLAAGATFRKRKERALNRLRNAWRRLYGS